MTAEKRRAIFNAGVALFAGGLLIIVWVDGRFSELPSYARIALLLPLSYSVPLLNIDTFANWSDSPGYARIRAGGALCTSIMLTIACLGWFVVALGA